MLKFKELDGFNNVVHDKKENIYFLIVSTDKTKITDLEISLFPIKKINNVFSIENESCGYALLSFIDLETAEVMFEVKENFRGRGLGNILVDYTKKIAKKVGYSKLKLEKITRYLDPILKQVDGNLMLYLSHNFKIDYKTLAQTNSQVKQDMLPMICDLEKETTMSKDKYMLRILKNRKDAYLKHRLK